MDTLKYDKNGHYCVEDIPFMKWFEFGAHCTEAPYGGE